MIKANELRIGNWYDQFGHFHQVTSSVIKDLENAPIDQLWCKPIPLTEEWLVRFGFRKDKDGLTWHYNHGLWISIGKNQYFAFGHSKWSIKHVHQLQNLFFCLCGEELQYKP